MPKLAISSIGKDKPGIVGAFTKVLYDYDCNIEDASMTILCNQFSMILIISGPEKLDLETLMTSLKQAGESFGLNTSINILPDDYDIKEQAGTSTPYMLCVSGSDRRGIAFKVTEVLAKYKVNITDFNSKLIGKDVKPVYVMMLEIEVPDSIEFAKLKAELDDISKEMDLDINFNEIECCNA
jgi:glycine cleavage system transcriptional repressor